MSDLKITTVIEFLEKLREHVCFIKFKKNDGTEKVMTCTLNFDFIHKDFYPKNQVSQSNRDEVVRVFDIQSQSWKSIIFANAIYLQTKENTYIIEFKGDMKNGKGKSPN